MIQVEALFQSFREQQVLDNMSFEVGQGEFFGIIGPNGSGKSTLLRLLSGMDPVMQGNVLLKGKKVSSYSRKELAKWVAVLQQDALPQSDSRFVKS
jgi:iron complex transport system ATP-binding protein